MNVLCLLGRRALAVSLLAGAMVVLAVRPAAAHGGVADSTNWQSKILDGGSFRLGWEMLGGDAMLSLRNSTGMTVTVSGYAGEPYLRFVPGEGVFRNMRSPATFLNQDRYANAALPESADPSAPPEWRRVSTGARYAWHDHRTHWMSPTKPPMVQSQPREHQRVLSWSVPVIVGDGAAGVSLEARGELWWVPGVDGRLYVVAAAALSFVVFALCVAFTAPAGNRWPGLARPLTLVVGLVWAADVVRVVDDGLAVQQPLLNQGIFLGVMAAVCPAIGAMAWRGWRSDLGGFFALVGSSLLLMLLFAAEQSSELSASQIATGLPLWVRRSTIAGSWVVVLPALMGAVLAIRSLEPRFVERHRDRTVQS